MPRSQDLLKVLAQVITADAASALPVVSYFLNRNLAGGWEGWLQVAYARAVLGAPLQAADFQREVNFPGTLQRCDLVFTPTRGVNMWVELKTQRQATYKTTVGDFAGDINKIYSLPLAFKQSNVLLAVAILRLQGTDAADLNTLRNSVKGGTMQYLLFTPGSPWQDVTATISTTVTGANQLLLASYSVI